jgi:hypothetical protein
VHEFVEATEDAPNHRKHVLPTLGVPERQRRFAV